MNDFLYALKREILFFYLTNKNDLFCTIGNVISNEHVQSEENVISPYTHFFQTNPFFHDKYK